MAANFFSSTGLQLAIVWIISAFFVHFSVAQTTAAADEGERILKRRADDAWFLEKSVRSLFFSLDALSCTAFPTLLRSFSDLLHFFVNLLGLLVLP